MNAYVGKVLHVNLTSGQVRSEVVDEKSLGLYLGGVGLGVNLLMEYSKPGRDAFDVDNPLIYCVGPLGGALGPAGHGYAVVSKSPLTGGVCVGQVQSFFGSELRRAGYVAVVIKGKASDLSYLWIDDGNVQIVDAQRFRGASVSDVEKKLCEELGDFSVCVSGIGEAGEKLCRVATIISDKYYAVDRGVGLGAVMGSKNLKALVVRGTHDVNVADMDSFASFVKVMYERDRALGVGNVSSSSSLLFRRLLVLNSFSALAARNWNNSVFEGVAKFVNDYLSDRFVTKSVGCAACGVSCNSVVMCSAGVFKDELALLNSDCLLSLGSLCGIDSLDAIVKAASLINEYGMDHVSVGALVAFAMDLYERGLITVEQAGGVNLRFGDVDAFLDLICKIGKSVDGLGKILAEGVARAAEVLGGEAAKFACHVKGLELPGYDLRALKTAALGFSLAFDGDATMRNGAELLDISGTADRYKIGNDVGGKLVEESFRYNVLDSLLICKLNPNTYSWKDMADYYFFATGTKISEEELKLVGKRVETLVRLFNILEGKGTRVFDDLPFKLKNYSISDDVSEKGMVVSDDELQEGIDSYYAASGWTADGIPTVDCLKQVGLGHLVYISENAIKAAHSREGN